MSSPSPRSTATAADALFDKYTLPKVALAIILAASLVGTWVTTALAGPSGVAVVLAKWSYLVALGVLSGGLLWKHAFVRPGDLDADAGGYCREMYDRFDRIAVGAVVVLGVAGSVVAADYLSRIGRGPLVVSYVAALVGTTGVVATSAARTRSVEDQFRGRHGLAALGLALAAVVCTAAAEVAQRGVDPTAAVVRALHLLAFAVWIGGAVWNVFVAVPTGQNRPTTAVVRAAGEQLERFRWAVRLVIPTILLTGLYQAADGVGTAAGTYLGTAVGVAVLAKVGSVGVLVVIFLLCPMWRACSPVDGVCDLEDLGGPSGDDPEVAADD